MSYHAPRPATATGHAGQRLGWREPFHRVHHAEPATDPVDQRRREAGVPPVAQQRIQPHPPRLGASASAASTVAASGPMFSHAAAPRRRGARRRRAQPPR